MTCEGTNGWTDAHAYVKLALCLKSNDINDKLVSLGALFYSEPVTLQMLSHSFISMTVFIQLNVQNQITIKTDLQHEQITYSPG